MTITTTNTTKARTNVFVGPIIAVLAIAVAAAALWRALDAEVCKDDNVSSLVISGLSNGVVDTVPVPTCLLRSEPKPGDLVSVPMPRPDPRKAVQ